jgi:hypothetical protein
MANRAIKCHKGIPECENMAVAGANGVDGIKIIKSHQLSGALAIYA